MTGIEMLRVWVQTEKEREHCPPMSGGVASDKCEAFETCNLCRAHWLSEIADQIERETLPRPLFEDGEPVQVGSELTSDSGNRHKLDGYRVYHDGEFELLSETSPHCWYTPRFKQGERVSRPELPDSWERIEKDAAKSVCGYFGREGSSCRAEPECPALNGDSCGKFKAEDIVRRCKALAGIEVDK